MSRYDDLVDLVSICTDDCVEWPYGKSGCGYGMVTVPGRGVTTTHRAALVIVTGEEPEELHALHGPCHNPLCINAAGGHLRWGTRSENMADRKRDGTRPGGSSHHWAKLTETQVAQIRDLEGSGLSRAVLSRRFGVSPNTITRVQRRETYTGNTATKAER